MGWRVVSEELGYNGASNADRGKGWQVSELRMYYLDNCPEQSKLGGTPMASGQLHPADGGKRTEEDLAQRAFDDDTNSYWVGATEPVTCVCSHTSSVTGLLECDAPGQCLGLYVPETRFVRSLQLVGDPFSQPKRISVQMYLQDTLIARRYQVGAMDYSDTCMNITTTFSSFLNSIDTDPPVLVGTVPLLNSEGNSPTSTIKLTFNEDIEFGPTGNIEFVNAGSDTKCAPSGSGGNDDYVENYPIPDVGVIIHGVGLKKSAWISKNNLFFRPLTPTAAGKIHCIRIPRGVITDKVGNLFEGLLVDMEYMFTAAQNGPKDTLASEVPQLHPLNNSMVATTRPRFQIMFTEVVVISDPSANIIITSEDEETIEIPLGDGEQVGLRDTL